MFCYDNTKWSCVAMIKLVSIGNRFMKDDGIAIAVAEYFKEKPADLNIDIVIGETDCLGCFYSLNENDLVIILDAICTGAEPGSIFVFSLKEVMAQASAFCMQHDMSMIELMRLYNRDYKGYFIGIEIADIDFGDELSPVLHEKLPQICSEAERIIKNIAKRDTAYYHY